MKKEVREIEVMTPTKVLKDYFITSDGKEFTIEIDAKLHHWDNWKLLRKKQIN